MAKVFVSENSHSGGKKDGPKREQNSSRQLSREDQDRRGLLRDELKLVDLCPLQVPNLQTFFSPRKRSRELLLKKETIFSSSFRTWPDVLH
jgi:hypothetical protein